MKDCQGNEFNVGSYLTSLECTSREPQIQCIAIFGDTAKFRWLHDDKEFARDQKNLSTSSWVVVKDKE